eukprot:428931_1
MFEDLIEIAMDQQFIQAIGNGTATNNKLLPIWRELLSKAEDEMEELESKLCDEHKLTFDVLFNEILGHYFIAQYLKSQHSIDKAVFIQDVNIFKSIKDDNMRKQALYKIYNTFCAPEKKNRIKGTSCFENSRIVTLRASVE